MTTEELVGTEIPVGEHTLRVIGVGAEDRCLVQLDKPGCLPRRASRGEMDTLREVYKERAQARTH